MQATAPRLSFVQAALLLSVLGISLSSPASPEPPDPPDEEGEPDEMPKNKRKSEE